MNVAKFSQRVVLFVIPVVFLIVGCALYFPFISRGNFPYEVLYQYQLDKIEEIRNYDTIFIGDSALGNTVDAEYFSAKTGNRSLNLALNGSYGYAGSYNMLKKAYQQNPSLKNVIVMQTMDMPTRGTSYQGYLYTVGSAQDILELSLSEIAKLTKASVDISRLRSQVKELWGGQFKRWLQQGQSLRSSDLIVMDYVKQGTGLRSPRIENGFSPNQINPDKYRFLKKISAFSNSHDLNLIYLHAPYFEKGVEQSGSYIAQINQDIQNIGISLIEEVISIPASEIGDSLDHIKPEAKKQYTQTVIRLLASGDR